MDFTGKVVTVVGGTSGIGREAVVAFAQRGAQVVVGGRDAARGHQVVEEVRALGGTAEFESIDVTDSASVRRFVDSAEALYGGIDCAFNAAGRESRPAPVHEIDEDDWQDLIDVRLSGLLRCLKYQVPALRRRGGGSIVNMAGDWGLQGVAGFGSACAAIHGIIGLTRSAAKDYAGVGIRVNALCPGAVRTPMLERMAAEKGVDPDDFAAHLAIGRIARSEEVVQAALWLASPASSYVSGESLVLNGGG